MYSAQDLMLSAEILYNSTMEAVKHVVVQSVPEAVLRYKAARNATVSMR